MKKHLITLFFIICFLPGFTQTKISLLKDQKVKKENNLYGITSGKEWLVSPKYDSIRGYEWNYVVAYRGNLADVYDNSYNKKLMADNLTPGKLKTCLSFANTGNDALYSNGKWGFKNSIVTIEPAYDSIFVVCTENGGKSCDDVVGIVENGKMGMVSNLGENFVTPDDYISMRYEFLDVAIEDHNFLGIATRANGERDFYKPRYNNLSPEEKLENFEVKYSAGKQGVADYKQFWKELKVFRSPDGNVGLKTGKGKIFVPAGADYISFQGLKFTADPESGLRIDRGVLTERNPADTLVIYSVLNKDIYFTDNTAITFHPKGLDEEFTQRAQINYDYRAINIHEFHCTYCKNGVQYWDERQTETRVIREEEKISYTTKVVWSELNEYGRFGTTTTSYTIPAEVETIVRSTPRSQTCTFCKGHVDYKRIFRWDEDSNAFVLYYNYGK